MGFLSSRRVVATLLVASQLAATAFASPAPGSYPTPTVQLDSAKFEGNSTGNISQFLGIPYALPPTGDLRLRLPQANLPYNGTYNATAFGASCPQLPVLAYFNNATIAQIYHNLTGGQGPSSNPQSEDCLTVNVWAPANATANSNLPVMVFIYGGGFEYGETISYDGGAVVQGSLALNMPVIYVSMNYRMAAFGFLASEEIKQAGVGNLGLQDQRLALRWVQRYIGAFGGDASKVTIFGQSAGSISVASHMVTNGGDNQGLFRAAIMMSGSPLPVGDISHGQIFYDAIVNQTGCAGSADTLQCLRQVPYDAFFAASNSAPYLFSNATLLTTFNPRVDGVFLTDNAQYLVQNGSFSNVPFIAGDVDDEGTSLSLLLSTNITTDAETRDFITSVYFSRTSPQNVTALLDLYPSDPADGSPFDTGSNNTLTPQFKRLSAIQGDIILQAPRRFLFEARSGKQDTWFYLYKRGKSVPYLGAAHSSDLEIVYGPGELRDYFVRFANTLNPNGNNSGICWPKYTNEVPNALTLLDGAVPLQITNDTYRAEGIALMQKLLLANPL